MQRVTRNLWLASAALLAGAAALLAPFFLIPPNSAAPAPGLQLSATETEAGRMRIRWQPPRDRVQAAGMLEVQEGGEFKRFPLQPSELQAGSHEYVRQEDDVTVSLLLYEDGRPGMQGVLRSVGPIVVPPPVTPPKIRATDERSRKADRPRAKSSKSRAAKSKRSSRRR
jgi:hypothetical protein